MQLDVCALAWIRLDPEVDPESGIRFVGQISSTEVHCDCSRIGPMVQAYRAEHA
jgi:hypothetical protein